MHEPVITTKTTKKTTTMTEKTIGTFVPPVGLFGLLLLLVVVVAALLDVAFAFSPKGGAATTAADRHRHPVAVVVVSSSPFEDEIGAQPPLGFFDPLGLLKDADRARFDRLRYVELKHGRVCMLAVLGHVVTTAGVRLPGDIDYHGTSFESIPSGLGALTAVPLAGWMQMFFFVGVLELAVMKDITGEGESVGDFRNGFVDFGWDTFSPEEKERKLAIELNNGRAAQMGILALMVHEKLDGDPYVINALLGSPVDF